MSSSLGLNAEELLHLAIADSRNGRHDEAIIKLKRCIAEEPGRAAAYHLLAAEHAEIGMYQDAIRELQHAVALDPAAVAAHFQLGLLYAVNNDPQQARRHWAPLASLDPDGPWNAFKNALESLMDGDSGTALGLLERGLAMNFANPALETDMQRLRERIKAAAKAGAASQAGRQAGDILLQTYGKPPSENDE